MSEEYVLVRDIIYDHNARMMNIKKYYPYFKLVESEFSQFQGGKYQELDMGYILMAILRFFIEENNFKEKDVTYDEYEKFISDLYKRDFDLHIMAEEERLLSSYIFDKIRNDGKPFTYQYFDPSEKKKKLIRMRIIDSRIKNNIITYYITSDAIEFYLDTKEIKDESTISIAQVLLGKMIESKNFRGGTEVIKRINSEVNRLKMRKNEVLSILSNDVFEGTKAYEDFFNTGIRWFEEEQKLFAKNMELIDEALKRTENNGEMGESVRDIYELETELKKSILKHSELLNACTQLQVQADEIILGAKFTRLRRNFDFSDALKTIMNEDNSILIKTLIEPLLKLNIKKSFSLTTIDKMLSIPLAKEEKGELIVESEEEMYVYDDEVEEQRIDDNFSMIILELLDFITLHDEFDLIEFNMNMQKKYGDSVLKNGDYYSLLVHMCQKKQYNIASIMEKPDTFFEKYICKAIKENKKESTYNLIFSLEKAEDETITLFDVAQVSNIRFTKQQEEVYDGEKS